MSDRILPVVVLKKVAQRFRILSDLSRLQLINNMMINGEMSVTELMEATDQQQANVSKHLNMMAREGILARRKEGLRVYYSLTDPTISDLCMLVCGRLSDEASADGEALRDATHNLRDRKQR